MNALLQTFRTLGPMKLSAIAGGAFGVIAFFIFMTSRVASPNMALLFSELGSRDATQIVSRLETQQVPFEIRGDGSQVYVPSDEVAQLRLEMAREGLPSGGSIGYEVFDKSDGLGTTSFVQNINQVRAMEGELARSMRTIATVRAARVHLVLPRRELFSRERQQPSASILLSMRGGQRLDKEQVLAIQHLVASAVPQLEPSRISIIDDKGHLLARGTEGGESLFAADAEERQRSFEARMSQTVEQLVERVVGYGKVRAEVSAQMDFDRITTNSEVYDPDGQVVRSTQNIEESVQSQERDSNPPVTVQNNLPDAAVDNEAGLSATSNEARSEETVNFEISKTMRSHVREVGNVRKLSVAVLIDGVYQPPANGEGEAAYQERTQQELDNIRTLVASAIGFDQQRGDRLEVVNMRFAPLGVTIDDEGPPTLFGLEKQDLVRIVEIVVLSIVALLIILLVVRPLVTRAFESLPSSDEMDDDDLPDLEIAPALAAPEAAALLEDEVEDDLLIDIGRIEGRVKASSVRKISEIVDKHPEEAVGIIRGWMYQEI
ncbi:MAG: flagellar basal-body MS-ring/collar protein FliF [Acetobacterales bacterium]